MPRAWNRCAVVGAMFVVGTSVVFPSSVVARDAARRTCKPPFLTWQDVGSALSVPTAHVQLTPSPSSAIPPAGSEPPFAGTTYTCDWNVTTTRESGVLEGRAYLYVFATPTDAKSWFAASTAQEDPRCKKISFTTTACLENVVSPPGVFPLFQAVQGRFAVWIHLKQLKLDTRPLKALASKVLMRAPKVT